jgi:hypothetical protein
MRMGSLDTSNGAEDMSQTKPIDSGVQFRLVRYNPIRKARGAPAAEVEIQDGSNIMVLWMNERDIRRNIDLYGPHEALLEALVAYKGDTEIAWKKKP